MPALILREARPHEREVVRDLTLAAYREYAAQMPPEHWEAYRWNIVTALEEVAPAQQIVAERDGEIVGAVLLYPAEGSMPGPEVRLLAVPPAGRGLGVGAALMEECVRRARRSGAEALTLHTTKFMQAAMRLYARMGFEPAPELDFHPLPEVTVEGYRLELRSRGGGHSV